MDASQYLEIFVEESKEHLQLLNESLLELEKDPVGNKDRINEVFRVAHTLKGMTGTMGYGNMNELSHIMEDALSEIRDGKVQVDAGLIDTLFACLDSLGKYIETVAETGTEGEQDNSKLIADLRSIVNKAEEAVVEKKEKTIGAPETGQEKGARSDILLPLTDMERQALKYAVRENLDIYVLTVDHAGQASRNRLWRDRQE
jgi:two-component system chemotaxis sensor kinase CheA